MSVGPPARAHDWTRVSPPWQIYRCRFVRCRTHAPDSHVPCAQIHALERTGLESPRQVSVLCRSVLH